MSTSLLMQQQTLLQALWAQAHTLPEWSQTSAEVSVSPQNPTPAEATLASMMHPAWERGLSAYRTNGYALAERALQATYPVLAELIGSDSFATLARHFWLRHPPEVGDLACWGALLPDFVARDPQLLEVPYLADVARVEWALHRAASAPDASAQPTSFALLSQHEPDAITLRLPPATALRDSAWPVVSLIQAHTEHAPSLDEVAAKLQAQHSETALVWRQGLRPNVAACTPAQAALLHALLHGQSLLAALDAALAAEADFDFTLWLNRAVPQGLVLGVALLH